MSTRAIKKALEAYRKTEAPLDERYVLIMQALDEVAAIERAAVNRDLDFFAALAKAVAADEVVPPPEQA